MKKLVDLPNRSVPVIGEYIDHNIIPEVPPEFNRQRNCVFCDIAHGDDPKTDLLYKDDNFVAFRNITPAASHHYLIIPKDHIKDAIRLGPQHVPMLQQMEAIAHEVMKQQGAMCMSSRVGFHWPPFISVPHLHLHAIAPVKELGVRPRILFQPGTRWFLTTKEVIAKIRNKRMMSAL